MNNPITINSANSIVGYVCDVDITRAVARKIDRLTYACQNGRESVTVRAILTVASESRDDSTRIHIPNPVVTEISNPEPTYVVGEDSGRNAKLSTRRLAF